MAAILDESNPKSRDLAKDSLVILSSFKNGYGKEQLLLDDTEKYWK